MAKRKSQPEPPPTPPRTVNFSRSLRVQLTPAEIATRADRAAHKLADAQAKQDELKASTKHHKAIIEAIMGEVHELSGEVRTKATYRMIECQKVYDYATSTVREVRLDTGEILDERRMSEAERQRELPFDGGEQPETEEDPDEGPDDEDAEEEDTF